MKNFFKRNLFNITLLVLGILCSTLLLLKLFPAASDRMTVLEKPSNHKDSVFFVAIGDSLTEGIGDSTSAGGYVPLLRDMLVEETHVNFMDFENFGKAGDRSDQIRKRIKKNKDIQKALKKADFITLTVGGNDLMKVVKNDLFNIDFETFDKPKEEYRENLIKLYEEIRLYNKTAPIYQMGIYNPFYLSFSEITEMQDIVDMWNQVAEDCITNETNGQFVAVNDDIYSGLQSEDTSEADGVNNLLSDQDNFHPNNLGYQILANEFKAKLLSTKKLWLQE